MIHANLSYRFLDHSDKDTYINFVKSFDDSQDTDNGFFKYIENNTSFITQEAECPTVGAFDNGTIVAALSGYYPEGPVWYMVNQFSKLGHDSLALATAFQLTTMRMNTMLANIAEDSGCFNFYVRKSVRSQKTIEKILQRITNQGHIEQRYNIYHDGFYPAGQEINKPGHDFFKALKNSDSLIFLHSLKQEERIKLLSNKYSDYQSAYK